MYHLLSYLTAPARRLIFLPQKLLKLSLSAQIAILVWIFLVICVVTAYVAFRMEDDPAWDEYTRPGRLAAIIAGVMVTPVVVYWALRFWLLREVSRYPDIDFAWHSGLAELERNGLDLSQIPIYLVVGSAGDAQERALFQAARLSLRVNETPKGDAALHWYAGPEAIYLCLTQTSQLSTLATIAKNATNVAGSLAPAPGPMVGGGGVRGTLVSMSESAPVTSSGPIAHESMPAAGRAPASDIRGTMMAATESVAALPSAAAQMAITLPPQEVAEQRRRLEYVCQLLRRARRPLCPMNGVLTLLPYGLIEHGPREAIEVQRALKGDVTVLRESLKLRCPVTAVVVGLEQENGFRELVSRVGADRAAAQRFGNRYSIWNPPLPEHMEALSAQACGAFEDWVYSLFREAGALNKPGNTRLYALLCKIRRNLQTRLTNILVAGYTTEGENEPAPELLLLSGCYFAAAGEGEGEGRQAFVKGVFDKLADQQEELEWSTAALVQEQRLRMLATFGFLVDTILLIALGGLIALKVWR
jgi:hypothetical protein